jgi:hypothetical protein
MDTNVAWTALYIVDGEHGERSRTFEVAKWLFSGPTEGAYLIFTTN